MTTHELARKLLACNDVPVKVEAKRARSSDSDVWEDDVWRDIVGVNDLDTRVVMVPDFDNYENGG